MEKIISPSFTRAFLLFFLSSVFVWVTYKTAINENWILAIMFAAAGLVIALRIHPQLTYVLVDENHIVFGGFFSKQRHYTLDKILDARTIRHIPFLRTREYRFWSCSSVYFTEGAVEKIERDLIWGDYLENKEVILKQVMKRMADGKTFPLRVQHAPEGNKQYFVAKEWKSCQFVSGVFFVESMSSPIASNRVVEKGKFFFITKKIRTENFWIYLEETNMHPTTAASICFKEFIQNQQLP